MRVVHTADVHLSKDYPERLDALEEVIEVAEDEDAKYLLITGDLFDANINVDDLKDDVKPLFRDNSFETLVIPGNHDYGAFRQKEHFGFTLLDSDENDVVTVGDEDVNIVALRYTKKNFEEVIPTLKDAVKDDKTNILMIHCTLSGSSTGYGKESKYLPVKPSELAQTGFDYVFAGHIHSSYNHRTFDNFEFVYSGSPVSISRSETGLREVGVLDTEKDNVEPKPLKTFHYESEKIELVPGEEQEKLERLDNSLERKDLDSATVLVNPVGFISGDETEFFDQIEDIVTSHNPEAFDIDKTDLNSSSFAERSLYQRFKNKMEERNIENPREVEKKFLRAYSRTER